MTIAPGMLTSQYVFMSPFPCTKLFISNTISISGKYFRRFLHNIKVENNPTVLLFISPYIIYEEHFSIFAPHVPAFLGGV
ncbi:hypothetical protein Echvi_3544 [Echinicola vietnamensis DSM 17526]|uniref:Uncharacterized protein n=1 Tax=Echinicola vietnamensis (strain DSM 17526 / LMG 23754 / KMM 6221) TaxID=926556 RepID=L0G4K5_ECHVK|nr:hypothetical protein Echvi_3544 [Echinicola vietnamensis DSM 17526]